MERHCWLFLALAGCGFDDFDKLITYETGVVEDGTVDELGDTSDTGLTGGTGPGGGSGNGSGGADCVDSDGDGVDTCSGDCDDGDADTYPGAAEREADSGLCMRDRDDDGFGDARAGAGVSAGSDCDDDDAELSPVDDDGDGVSSCEGDCDDNDPRRSPDETEIPEDGRDSDCDGEDGGFSVEEVGPGGPAYDIEDNSTTRSTVTVRDCPTVWEVSVSVDIEHTYVSDLTVRLVGPTGLAVVLHNRDGGADDNISGTYISGNIGSLESAEDLSALTGSSGTGTWTLEISDSVYSDEGRLNRWILGLTCS